jgi:maleylpyruvate isomerase
LLPGWSRGHVLSHLARNADAYRRVLDGAARGQRVPAYASRDERDADIDAGASRTIGEQLADLERSAALFSTTVASMPIGSWSAPTDWPAIDPRPASAMLDSRIREIAIHHVDLDAGYTAAHWPVPLARQILGSVAVRFDTLGMSPVTLSADDGAVAHTFGDGSGALISGPSHALAWWLIGRSDGSELRSSAGPLPVPPPWL